MLSVPAYVRKKPVNPGRRTGCTSDRMMGESPDIQYGIRFLTCNVGSMSGKWGNLSETLKRCCINICCLQEVTWKGQGAKMIGNGFKFFWSGGYELVDKFVTSEKVLVGGNFIGHVGSNMGGFREAHRGFGMGQINDGGVRLLDWAVSKGL